LSKEEIEKARLRREFLMSGVPDELRRQITTTSLNTQIADYPPIPEHNHILQHDDLSLPALSIPLCKKIQFKRDCDVDDDFYLNRKWNPTTSRKSIKTKSVIPFKNFTGHPNLPKDYVNLVLADLQDSDGSFPFKETYQHLESHIAQSRTVESRVDVNDISNVKLKSMDDSVIVVDEATEQQDDERPIRLTDRNCLWSDLHFPNSSKQMVGNIKSLQIMKEWLMEWKLIMEKEASKEKRRDQVRKNSQKEKDKAWSDDSDFDSDDSEEEDLSLCNTTLITGPYGVGKTSAVYALAQEMGYKVFEVNPSSLRSGKQLLSQLEEATQSHRVSQRKSMADITQPDKLNGNLIQEQVCKKQKSTSSTKSTTNNPLAKFFSTKIIKQC